MKVACPHCRHPFEEPYYRLGTTARCPNCLAGFPLRQQDVLDRGNTGYQLTCDDFRQLLRDYMSGLDVQTLIIEPVERLGHLGPICSQAHSEHGWSFCSADRQRWFDASELHLVVQQSDDSQQAIYRYAMTQWH
ncbi:MAG: hypothetical protein U1G07_20320 [Verrucomicrobiota bacterium]